MKRVIGILLLTFLAVSCIKSTTEISLITSSPNKLEFKPEGGVKTAKVYFTSTVKISVSQNIGEWCEVSPAQAIASKENEVDSVTITVRCKENTTAQDRQGQILLDNSSVNSSLFISQEGVDL